MLEALLFICKAFGFIVDAFGAALIAWVVLTSLVRR